jgi:glutathione synthase
MRIAFVADPLESLDAAIDTSVGLMHAAQDRGAEVWVTEAGHLEAVHGRARALARRVRLAPSHPVDGHRWAVPKHWFTAERPEHVWLDEMAAIFIRTEPPVDATYTYATLILDLVDPSRTRIINDPRGLRACSEHLLPLRFLDLIPPTVVTTDERAIRAFLAEHGEAVVKPVDGFSGRGVLRLDRHDPNLASLIEISTANGSTPVVVQRFLREVNAGNKRLFVVGGEPVGAVYRYPVAGDFRIGNPSAEAPITARDREICQRLAPVLRANGIHLAGLDVIGPYLIEVNVTSVGALRKADALLGWTLCADLLDSVFCARSFLARAARGLNPMSSLVAARADSPGGSRPERLLSPDIGGRLATRANYRRAAVYPLAHGHPAGAGDGGDDDPGLQERNGQAPDELGANPATEGARKDHQRGQRPIGQTGCGEGRADQ